MGASKLMTCWECEAVTSQPRAVTVPVCSGAIGPLKLCPSCYQAYYLPLIAEAASRGPDQTHPAPPRRTPRRS
jgi:hypothetical protein